MRFSILFTMILFVLGMQGCGWSALNNSIIGQPKRIMRLNPILCDNRTDLDLSLGIMRNGVGSMSTEDQLFTVPNEKDIEILQKANETGAVVKITYDVKRFTWCWKNHIVTKVEIIK